MRWLARLFRRMAEVLEPSPVAITPKRAGPTPPGNTTRSYREWQDLTPWEVRVFRETLCCPDCGQHRLLKGPEGGGINVYCGNPDCGSRFNEMFVFGVQRISDAQPCKPREAPDGQFPQR